jgi:hypothetical protein
VRPAAAPKSHPAGAARPVDLLIGRKPTLRVAIVVGSGVAAGPGTMGSWERPGPYSTR